MFQPLFLFVCLFRIRSLWPSRRGFGEPGFLQREIYRWDWAVLGNRDVRGTETEARAARTEQLEIMGGSKQYHQPGKQHQVLGMRVEKRLQKNLNPIVIPLVVLLLRSAKAF